MIILGWCTAVMQHTTRISQGMCTAVMQDTLHILLWSAVKQSLVSLVVKLRMVYRSDAEHHPLFRFYESA